MRIKSALITLALSATALAATAQDKIYMQNGDVINGKVKEIAPRTVTYKKQDNPDGPDFIVNRREVASIKYANGTEDVLEDNQDDYDDRRDSRDRYRVRRFSASREQYPKNILSIAPLQMANEGAAGIGLHYERVLDKRSIFSFYLPFAAIFYNEQRYTNNGPNEKTTRTFCYFYPGAKFYPAGSNRRVSYGVGPSLALGFGNRFVNDYYNGTYREKSVFKSGVLLNNSLNMMPTKHLFIGIELGLGFTYYNNEDDFNNTFDSDEPLVQFNFSIGYRF